MSKEENREIKVTFTREEFQYIRAALILGINRAIINDSQDIAERFLELADRVKIILDMWE